VRRQDLHPRRSPEVAARRAGVLPGQQHSGVKPSTLRRARRDGQVPGSRDPALWREPRRGGRSLQLRHQAGLQFSLAVRSRAGDQLVIAGHDATVVADRANELTASGVAVRAVAGDLTLPDAARRAVALAKQGFGGLDVVVNVAGGLLNYGPVLEVQPEQLDREVAVNLETAFLVSQAAIPALLERGGGAIVNFASVAVLKPQRHM